jgi:hypothetical protein
MTPVQELQQLTARLITEFHVGNISEAMRINLAISQILWTEHHRKEADDDGPKRAGA